MCVCVWGGGRGGVAADCVRWLCFWVPGQCPCCGTVMGLAAGHAVGLPAAGGVCYCVANPGSRWAPHSSACSQTRQSTGESAVLLVGVPAGRAVQQGLLCSTLSLPAALTTSSASLAPAAWWILYGGDASGCLWVGLLLWQSAGAGCGAQLLCEAACCCNCSLLLRSPPAGWPPRLAEQLSRACLAAPGGLRRH
jgi:hypothetical protein